MDENQLREKAEKIDRLESEPLLEFHYETNWPLTILMYVAVIAIVAGAIWVIVKRAKSS